MTPGPLTAAGADRDCSAPRAISPVRRRQDVLGCRLTPKSLALTKNNQVVIILTICQAPYGLEWAMRPLG